MNLKLRLNYGLLVCFLMIPFAFLSAQGVLKGGVKDDKGQPLSGATVMVGTDYGAYSDEEGNFRVENIPTGDYTLTVSYFGYTDYTAPIAIGATEIAVEVTLNEAASTANEVVIVGYGTMRKRDLTSSIAKVKEVNDNVGNSFEVNLQGKAPGVQVIQSSGAAGTGAVVRIRGLNSISASGDPLYVVDGIPITQDIFPSGASANRGGQNNNPLNSINPNDIESIEILKDAAAAGIYGSRGANGVILITTKKGQTGKPEFDFTARVGASTPTKLHKFTNNQEWLQLRQEAWENDGNVGRAPLPRNMTWENALKTNTDWVGMTVGTGVKQEYTMGMKQGTKKFSSYLGAGYLNDESYLRGNNFQRYSGRYNLDWNVAKWIKVSANTSLSQGLNNRVSQAWDAGGFGAANSTLLNIYPGDDYLGGDDPTFRRNHRKWRTVEWRSINNGTISLTPIKNLEIRGTGNYDFMNWDDNIYEDTVYDQTNHIARASRSRVITRNRSANLTAQYNFELGQNHTLYILAGTEAQKSVTEYTSLSLDNADRPIYLRPNPIGDLTIDTTSVYKAPVQAWSFLSYFSRLNYAFKDKYFVQGTIRRDASSRFGSNYRWGTFPTVGVAWIISEEGFLKESKTLNMLKVKASWGYTGNANIPNYQRFGYFQNSNFTYNDSAIIFPTQLANPDLRWEKTRTIDGGIEVGLWNDRLQFGVEFYDKHTTDLLINGVVQSSTGFGTYYQNVGSIMNRGVEFSLTATPIDLKNFRWTTNLNIARNVNKVLDIGGASPDALSGGTNDTRILVGYPIGTHFRVKWGGVDPLDGKPIYLDTLGNPTKQWSEAHRVVVGKVLPDAVGGFSNTFAIGNFDINALITYSIGGDIYDNSVKRQMGVVTDWNMRTEIFDRWRKPGDMATYPRLTMDPGMYGLSSEWQYNSTLWLYDASYVRMKNLTVGYTYKMPTTSKIKSLRLYAIGTNLFTLTNYPGLDPEIARDFENPQDRNMSVGITYLSAPQQRSFSIGINVGL